MRHQFNRALLEHLVAFLEIPLNAPHLLVESREVLLGGSIDSVQRQGPLCNLHPPTRGSAPALPPPVLASQHWLPVCQKDRFSRFYYVFKSLNGLSDLLSPSPGSLRSSEGRRSRDRCCRPPDWAGSNCNS